MEYSGKLEGLFDKFSEEGLMFKDCEHKFHPNVKLSAILFLESKLKDKSKPFLEGQHDTIYIGQSFEDFEDFTEEDTKIAVYHGIYLADDRGGFQIWASM